MVNVCMTLIIPILARLSPREPRHSTLCVVGSTFGDAPAYAVSGSSVSEIELMQ